MPRFPLLLFVILALQSCLPQSKEVGILSLGEDEKQDILSVIEAESEAFYARDFEAWRSKYAGDPVNWTCVEEGGLVLEAYSRSELDQFVGDYLRENPTPDTLAIQRKNVRFIPEGNTAWVTFDEYQTAHGRTKVLKGVRLMTKKENKWRISGMTSTFVRYQ